MSERALTRVLYAEDEPDIREVALLALVDVGGLEVVACENGLDALRKVADFAPDLILLDVMMPDMDGPTTMKHLREREETKTTPVIFMTAKVQAHEAAEYQALGAAGVIPKPFDPMTLADQIREVWSKR
ncbi:MAG: response regulator [Myxococcales bacterium]|nr:response regulator [Myxococcales bacterium]